MTARPWYAKYKDLPEYMFPYEQSYRYSNRRNPVPVKKLHGDVVDVDVEQHNSDAEVFGTSPLAVVGFRVDSDTQSVRILFEAPDGTRVWGHYPIGDKA